jgi:hypothetical protein
VTLVVVEVAAPSREELTAARALNACASERDTASAETLAGDGVGSALVQRFAPREQPSAPGAGPAGGGTAAHPGGVLASTVEKTAHAVRPFLVGLLVAAILLLGLAALPRVAVPDPRINDLLARYRIEIAGAGAAALAAAAIAFLIG